MKANAMLRLLIVVLSFVIFVSVACTTPSQPTCSSHFNAEESSSVKLNVSNCRSGSFTIPVSGISVVNGKMKSIKVWQKGKAEYVLIPGQTAVFYSTGEVYWRTID